MHLALLVLIHLIGVLIGFVVIFRMHDIQTVHEFFYKFATNPDVERELVIVLFWPLIIPISSLLYVLFIVCKFVFNFVIMILLTLVSKINNRITFAEIAYKGKNNVTK